MSRGKEFELALKRAAAQYRKQGRGVFLRQFPNMRQNGQYVSRAPLDFVGCLAGARAAFVEAKSTDDTRVEIDNEHGFREDQLGAGNAFHDLGAEGWLALYFGAHDAAYAIPWLHVREFCAEPYRKSFSLQFAQAYGLRLPMTSVEPWVVFFLDGVPDELHDAAFEAVAAEKTKKGRVVLWEVPELPPATTRGPEHLTKEERLERVRVATQEGIANAARRTPRRARRTFGSSR